MKRSILLLLVVVCIAAITLVSCKEPEPYNEVEYYEDGTTLKSVTEINGNGTPIKKTEYDKSGNIIKLTDYHPEDFRPSWSLYTYITYEYDSANRMTKETHYGYSGEIYYGLTHEYEYDTEGNKTVTNFGYNTGIVTSKTEYDASGNKLKETAFNSDGTIKTITDADGNIKWYNKYYNDGSKDTIYEYDDDGNLTKETKYDYGRISYCTEYDTDGKKTTTYKEDGSVASLSEYDSLGNPIRTTFYFFNGYYNVREYDSTGNIIKVTSYSPEGTRIEWEEYEYDSNGNETMYKYYDGHLKTWKEYEYHSNGEKSKETSYYDDGTIKNILEYYSDGKKSKETTYYSDGESKVQEYDTNENIIKYIYFNSDGSISFWHEYDYDSNGNETKQTRYNPDGTIKDIIEYGGSAGLAIKYTAYRADGSVLFVHECSSANCYLEIGTWSDPPVGGSGIVIFEYNNNSRLTKGTYYYSDGSIQSVKTY